MPLTNRYPTATRWLLGLMLVACLVIVMTITYNKATHADDAAKTYRPVSSHFLGFVPDKPTVHYTDPVTATMVFCNNTDHPVLGSSSLNWQAVDPTGKYLVEVGQSATLYAGNRYQRPAGPGCSAPRAIDFNQPTEVQRIDQHLIDRGIAHRWRISAGFTPITPDGKFGAPDTFDSPAFTVEP